MTEPLDAPPPLSTGRLLDIFITERLALLGLLVASGLVLIFLWIADQVGENDTGAFDDAVTAWLRSPGDPATPLGSARFADMVRDVTALGSTAVLTLLVVGVVLYLLLARMRGAALLVALSVLGGTLISTVLKALYDRPRPDLAQLAYELSASFPSGHSMLSAVTYLTLGALLARLAPSRALKVYALAAAIFITLLVGISRVYLGVHYPTDVLAGWCLGAAWALFCSIIALRLQRRRAIAGAPIPERDLP